MKKQVELGAPVWAEDGRVGTVEKIVADLDEHRPGYLVVKRGRLRPRHIVVPVSLVSDVSPEGVALATTRQALESFPDYEVVVQHGSYQKPIPMPRRPVAIYTPPGNQGYMRLRQRSVPDSSVSVERGMGVLDVAGLKVGQMEGLMLDSDSRQASHIVLRWPEPWMASRQLIPADLVAKVQGGQVHLRITAEHVYGLGVYEPAPGHITSH